MGELKRSAGLPCMANGLLCLLLNFFGCIKGDIIIVIMFSLEESTSKLLNKRISDDGN